MKNNYILSAAHCFTHKDTQNAEYLQVWIGGVDLDKQNDKGVTVGVEKIVLADYDDHTKVNDIAVLKVRLSSFKLIPIVNIYLFIILHFS